MSYVIIKDAEAERANQEHSLDRIVLELLRRYTGPIWTIWRRRKSLSISETRSSSP